MKKEVVCSAPSLSIVLLCWNHARFLEQCIASIADQGTQNFEIIFLDNMSSDGSFELAVELFKRYGLDAKMYRNASPRSISANCNRLLSLASGTLIAPLSTDDWYAPKYVERMRSAAQRHPACALYGTNGWYVFEDTGLTEPSRSPPLMDQWVGSEFLFEEKFFFWVGFCYRRAALLQVGGWDDRQSIEDMDLLYRLMKEFPVTQLSDHLVYYRRSSSSISLDPIFMAEGRLKFFQKHRNDFTGDWNRIVSEVLRSCAAVAVDKGRLLSAFRLVFRSLILRPSHRDSWKTFFYLLRMTVLRIK